MGVLWKLRLVGVNVLVLLFLALDVLEGAMIELGFDDLLAIGLLVAGTILLAPWQREGVGRTTAWIAVGLLGLIAFTDLAAASGSSWDEFVTLLVALTLPFVTFPKLGSFAVGCFRT